MFVGWHCCCVRLNPPHLSIHLMFHSLTPVVLTVQHIYSPGEDGMELMHRIAGYLSQLFSYCCSYILLNMLGREYRPERLFIHGSRVLGMVRKCGHVSTSLLLPHSFVLLFFCSLRRLAERSPRPVHRSDEGQVEMGWDRSSDARVCSSSTDDRRCRHS